MVIQRTLSIIKPDATRRNLTGAINQKLENAGLRIIAQKRIKLSKEQAGIFYLVHKERPFYDELCSFMASDPIVVQVLEGEDAGHALVVDHPPTVLRYSVVPVQISVANPRHNPSHR